MSRSHIDPSRVEEAQGTDAPRAGDPSRAIRILALDEEIAALEHVSPKARLYLALIIPLVLMLIPLMILISRNAGDANLEMLYLFSPVLILVLVPTVIYGIEMMKNRRRLRRLEEELDKLIAYQETGPAHRTTWGGEEGGVIL
jgi:hypothetical protein